MATRCVWSTRSAARGIVLAPDHPSSLRDVARLRRRLTAWYVVTLALTALILDAGLYVAVRKQLDLRLRRTLVQRVASLEYAARQRDPEDSAKPAFAALGRLRLVGRNVFLLTPAGVPILPAVAPLWIRQLAPRAVSGGSYFTQLAMDGREREQPFGAWEARFLLDDSVAVVAVATSESAEMQEEYMGVIVAFGGATLLALLLIAVGGWFLARKSTAPIERSIIQMRDFMSDAAHELRTPVTVIRTGAEVAIQQPREPERYVEALTGVAAESRRLGTILDDLLVLARADAGQRPLERQQFFLDDVTADAVNAARPLAEAAGVALELEQFDEVEVLGDSGLLRQLLMILVDNAIKYTPAGGIVGVRVGLIDGTPSVMVQDTGIGIALEDVPRIFERFYRVDRGRPLSGTAGTAVGGAGLGLAIARWIADAHHAEIAVSSTVGAGTAVTVRFPRTPASA